VPISRIDEGPANPRTEFPDNKVAELADDIRQHGILEPLVVHPESSSGRYLLREAARSWSDSAFPRAVVKHCGSVYAIVIPLQGTCHASSGSRRSQCSRQQ
jgi:hypothetical protein